MCCAFKFCLLRDPVRLRYNSPPASAAQEKRECFDGATEKERVDELSETVHNLTSLLLMNTTLHRQRGKVVQNTKFFNNQQSISVGV
jgi:hypothetical protein